MREILFRGKTQNCSYQENEKWIYGYYVKQENRHIITDTTKGCFGFGLEVNENTVGQFTGITDKNGKKIFEGDIVVSRYPNGKVCSVGDIQFDCGVFGVEWKHHKKYKTMVGGFGQLHNLRRLDDDFIEQIEVIGNIHDNKELLGE